MGIIAGLVAFGLAFATRPHGTARAPVRSATGLETRVAALRARTRRRPASACGAATGRSPASLTWPSSSTASRAPSCSTATSSRVTPEGLRATVPVQLGDTTLDTIAASADVPHDALLVDLTAAPGGSAVGSSIAIRAETSSEGQVIFVSGVGQIADRATVSGGALLVDAEPHPIGVVSAAGPVSVEAMMEETQFSASRCAS